MCAIVSNAAYDSNTLRPVIFCPFLPLSIAPGIPSYLIITAA